MCVTLLWNQNQSQASFDSCCNSHLEISRDVCEGGRFSLCFICACTHLWCNRCVFWTTCREHQMEERQEASTATAAATVRCPNMASLATPLLPVTGTSRPPTATSPSPTAATTLPPLLLPPLPRGEVEVFPCWVKPCCA